MHEAALFQKIFKFCAFLKKFSNVLPFFALFLKNGTHAITLRIDPLGIMSTSSSYYDIILKLIFSNFEQICFAVKSKCNSSNYCIIEGLSYPFKVLRVQQLAYVA